MRPNQLAKCVAVVIACSLQWATPSAGFAATPQATAKTPATTTADAPPAAASESQAMRDAVAAVIVVALTEQFSGKDVAVDIDDYVVRIASARQRMVSGHGTANIIGPDKHKTFGFSYRTLYDVVSGLSGYPSISITGAGDGGERLVPNDSVLVGQLEDRVASTISHDLGGKRVWLQLDGIESYESGDRYVRIDARGIADFGADGRSSINIEALYDRTPGTWLRSYYTLGDEAGTPQ